MGSRFPDRPHPLKTPAYCFSISEMNPSVGAFTFLPASLVLRVVLIGSLELEGNTEA